MKKINYERHSGTFKALCHPTRLKLAHKLRNGEKCVCELNDFVAIEQPTLSRHLKILKDAGVLTSRKNGMQVFYQLSYPCMIDNILSCLIVKNKGRISR